jgi:hypothetical protein
VDFGKNLKGLRILEVDGINIAISEIAQVMVIIHRILRRSFTSNKSRPGGQVL